MHRQCLIMRLLIRHALIQGISLSPLVPHEVGLACAQRLPVLDGLPNTLKHHVVGSEGIKPRTRQMLRHSNDLAC